MGTIRRRSPGGERDRRRGSADSTGTSDPPATDESQARRRFAIPEAVAVIDGDEVEIDPPDEDGRGLAIRAEHPEYREVLDDPSSEELVDGVDPRLHIALHLIVANQLWDDDPPEVWQAARRLLDQGHERHTILHALAHELAQVVHPTLTGQAQPDPGMTAYRARLREL